MNNRARRETCSDRVRPATTIRKNLNRPRACLRRGVAVVRRDNLRQTSDAGRVRTAYKKDPCRFSDLHVSNDALLRFLRRISLDVPEQMYDFNATNGRTRPGLSARGVAQRETGFLTSFHETVRAEPEPEPGTNKQNDRVARSKRLACGFRPYFDRVRPRPPTTT